MYEHAMPKACVWCKGIKPETVEIKKPAVLPLDDTAQGTAAGIEPTMAGWNLEVTVAFNAPCDREYRL